MKKETLRYSASKLHQKGILHSIDGLPENQFKTSYLKLFQPTQTAFSLSTPNSWESGWNMLKLIFKICCSFNTKEFR